MQWCYAVTEDHTRCSFRSYQFIPYNLLYLLLVCARIFLNNIVIFGAIWLFVRQSATKAIRIKPYLSSNQTYALYIYIDKKSQKDSSKDAVQCLGGSFILSSFTKLWSRKFNTRWNAVFLAGPFRPARKKTHQSLVKYRPLQNDLYVLCILYSHIHTLSTWQIAL